MGTLEVIEPRSLRMPQATSSIRGFRSVFVVTGALYILMASSMLAQGVGVLRDFAVPEHLLTAPVFEDFFLFFYQLMAFIGVLGVTFGLAVKGRREQVVVAGVFTVANILIALRDLSTSDSSWGNQLYQGEATLMFVAISVTFALAYGALVLMGVRASSPPQA